MNESDQAGRGQPQAVSTASNFSFLRQSISVSVTLLHLSPKLRVWFPTGFEQILFHSKIARHLAQERDTLVDATPGFHVF
jgi:hypothetical protein